MNKICSKIHIRVKVANNKLLINNKMANNYVYKVDTMCTTRGVMATRANTTEKNDIYRNTSLQVAQWKS